MTTPNTDQDILSLVPFPTVFTAPTLQLALKAYTEGITEIFKDARDLGMSLQVHTVQILQQPDCFTVVAFTKDDRIQQLMQESYKIARQGAVDAMADLEQKECSEHEYDINMTCIHCGHQL